MVMDKILKLIKSLNHTFLLAVACIMTAGFVNPFLVLFIFIVFFLVDKHFFPQEENDITSPEEMRRIFNEVYLDILMKKASFGNLEESETIVIASPEAKEPQLEPHSNSQSSQNSSINTPTQRKKRKPVPTVASISPAKTDATKKRKPKVSSTPTRGGSKRRSRREKSSN